MVIFVWLPYFRGFQKYHDRDLEQVTEFIEQNRDVLVVWALQPRKYQSAI